MKVRIFIITLIVALILGGCSSNVKNIKEETQMADMNSWEVELLCDAYKTKAEQNRVKSGELYDHQEKTLELLRGVCEYLREKYPQNKITVTEIKPELFMNGSTVFEFTVDGFDGTYTAIAKNSDETYFTDDFYAELVRPGYESYLRDILEKKDIDVVFIETEFTASLGMEYNEKMTVNDLIDAGEEIPRTTTVYIKSDDGKNTTEKVKELMKNIYGYYFINCSEYFVEGLTSEDYDLMVKNNSDEIESASFGVK